MVLKKMGGLTGGRGKMCKFKNAEKLRFITIFVYFSRETAIFSPREIRFFSCEIAISSSTSRKTQKSLQIAISRLKYIKIIKNDIH